MKPYSILLLLFCTSFISFAEGPSSAAQEKGCNTLAFYEASGKREHLQTNINRFFANIHSMTDSNRTIILMKLAHDFKMQKFDNKRAQIFDLIAEPIIKTNERLGSSILNDPKKLNKLLDLNQRIFLVRSNNFSKPGNEVNRVAEALQSIKEDLDEFVRKNKALIEEVEKESSHFLKEYHALYILFNMLIKNNVIDDLERGQATDTLLQRFRNTYLIVVRPLEDFDVIERNPLFQEIRKN